MSRTNLLFLSFLAFVAASAAASGRLLLQEDSGAGADSTATKWKKPWFCHGLDCPEYDVVSTTDDYEVRDYKSGTWVYTNTTGYRYETAVTKGFTTLYRYISGHNKDKEKLDMTTPVATMLLPDKDFISVSENFTVAFYLPYEYQKKEEPPKPSAESVGLVEDAGGKAFVSSFEGFATQGTILLEAAKLRDALRAKDEKFDESAIWFLSYDPPTRLTGRHNEVSFGQSKSKSFSKLVNAVNSVVQAA